ncbi:hypothetical protein [Mesorhizobium sp.]|uniref:hypothetical protein n=1 Tax=Mesorhizobium sp. TaxID=1871066 RepID=UPI00257D2500|nr:hypothetical protein [Mesorhizobium sp.]
MRATSWLRPKALLLFWVAVALLVDPQAPGGQLALGEFGPRSALADDDGGGDDGGGDDGSGDDGGRSGASPGGSRTTSSRSTGPNLFRALTDRFLPRPPRRSGTRATASRPFAVSGTGPDRGDRAEFG